MINEKEITVLTIAQMAEKLQISKSTAYKLARTKGFPISKIGKRVLIPYQKLIEWLEKGGSSDV